MVVFNNAMAGAAGSGGAAGYTIDNSLRFNLGDSAYLSRTVGGTATTFTISCWVKLGNLTAFTALFGFGSATYSDTVFFPGDGRVSLYNGSTTAHTYSTALLRDPSAWYHFVVKVTSGNPVLYVNGSLFLSASNYSWEMNGDSLIGAFNGSGTPQYFFDGYIANFHCIENQALSPTDFGAFDADTGVWNPIKYAGTYGTNGFHLPFSDNSSASALGTDSSGNSNNWTVNNIDPISNPASQTFSEEFWTQYKSTYNNNSTAQTKTGSKYRIALDDLFAGVNDLTSYSASTLFGISRFNSQGYIHASLTSSDGTATTGFGNSTQTGSDWKAYFDYPANSGKYASITTYDGAEADGTDFPVNRVGCDYMVDSPTNGDPTLDTGLGGELPGNYCTWNGIGSHNKSNNLLSNGNLDANHLSSGWDGTFIGTFGVSSGKWYWETTWTGGNNADIGVTEDPNYSLAYLGYGDGVGLKHNGYIYQNTAFGSASVAAGVTLSINDVVGVALDLDNGKMWYSVNGTWVNSGDPVAGTGNLSSNLVGTFYPAFTHLNGAGTAQCTANFGQRPFAYQAPAGYKCLCTANLPDPDIADGSTVMDVTLYTGNSPSTQTISGLGFSPDLVWIKDRASGSGHRLTDTVRGATKALESYDTTAEATEVNGLTAFTSDGFTVGSQSHYNSGSLVAWTWDGGSSTVANTDGSISSSVRANASAGFSIVTYTGNGTAGSTVGHGLNVAPAFVVFKSRSATGNWLTYHKSLGNNYYLWLDTTGAQVNVANTFGVNASTLTIQEYSNYNTNGTTYVAYCWAPVEGYSAFGSYTGNAAADGPFVYTGFRPKVIITKAYGTTSSWGIWDTERDTYNAADATLYPNSAGQEDTGGAYPFDILSNGFKVRNTANFINATSGVIYMAWAENPFKYARAR